MGGDLVRLEVGEVGVEHRAFRCRDTCLVGDTECAAPVRLPEIRLAVSYVNMSCKMAR